MLERAYCGVEITWSNTRSPETPYRSTCRCMRGWRSAPVCHRCSCTACAKKRAEWDEYLAAGGLLGEQRRKAAEGKR